jgi:hypothetical protein
MREGPVAHQALPVGRIVAGGGEGRRDLILLPD